MILKKHFNPIAVVWYLRWELGMSTFLSILIYSLYCEKGMVQISLPFSVAAILGSALAIFVAFRNNSSYARWWEARTLWGGIINSSRVLGRLMITFADSHAHQANFDYERAESFKKEMVYKVIAWAHALRLHLRGQHENWHEIEPFLSKEEFETLQKMQHLGGHAANHSQI